MDGGLKWLYMDYLLRRCWLLTARIDWCSLTRDHRLVEIKLVKKLSLRSDVEDLSPLVDHAEPLGLTDSQLSFGYKLHLDSWLSL